jgi:serine/threonine protein kinase
VGTTAVKDDLRVGDTLGPYRLEEHLGEGAMGCVFRAKSASGRTVALKVIRIEFADDARYRRRFKHEARAASEVKHRNLVDVLESGEVDGRQFLAMRFVRGPALERRIREGGPLPAPAVARVAREIGGAIDALHAVDIVHRDIKTSNILLDDDDDGSAALTDFGLSKGTNYAALTRPGQILGTLGYLAPERIRGEVASASSDVYALGCVIYECVTGEPPFGSQGPMQAAFSHLETPPDNPCAKRAELPPGLGPAVLAALAKDPADRPPTGRAYADLLRAAVAG